MPRGDAAFIDTTGSFSPLLLFNIVRARLMVTEGEGKNNEKNEALVAGRLAKGDIDLNEKVNKCLDRVSIMRALDFVGVVEAVKEVRRKFEEAAESRHKDIPTFKVPMNEIPDSEDEEGEDDLDSGKDARETFTGKTRECPGIIVIDTITNVASIELTRSQVQGKPLLFLFLGFAKRCFWPRIYAVVQTVFVESCTGLQHLCHHSQRMHNLQG
jgi:hypothetical protein